MTKTTIPSMAEDVMKMDHALIALLKGIRALAEGLRKDTQDVRAKEQLEKVLSRQVVVQKKMPVKPKTEKTTESDRRLRKVGRVLAALPDGQLRIVIDLARSMARGHSNDTRPKKGSASSKEITPDDKGGDSTTSFPNTTTRKD